MHSPPAFSTEHDNRCPNPVLFYDFPVTVMKAQRLDFIAIFMMKERMITITTYRWAERAVVERGGRP